ncbi:MAG: gliding motility-associated C-terminal domain-containing protein [Cytophagaceae bacterium]|nr:gliding motility-associated C-terminal domain-containing protein [Cytophagaceae bacterium]
MKGPLHKFYCIVFILLLLTVKAIAQNLVPNPSFEILKAGYPPCYNSGTYQDFEFYMSNWKAPNKGTSDILSTLSPVWCMTAMPVSNAPANNYFPIGSQMPRTGNNFVGFKPYFENRREYLKVKFDCPMEPGKKYYCEMYVSLAEQTNYAQNLIGMYFSDTDVFVDTFAMLSFTPQIVETNVINDTINWVKISDTITATSAWQYLIIGSFATNAQMTIEYLGDKGDINFTYYYIDDVSVIPLEIPPLVVTGDTIVCPGDSIHLSASGWTNIKWYTASNPNTAITAGADLNAVPPATINYIAKGKVCNTTYSRTQNVLVNAKPVIDLGKDTSICFGTNLTLHAGAGLNNYLWQDGSVMESFNASLIGIYHVQAANDSGCIDRDTISIDYYNVPSVNFGPDLLVCNPEGDFAVDVLQPYDVYVWQDGSAASSFHYKGAGTYYVTITNICGGKASDTIMVNEIHLFLPNLVTPNDDGKNDRFEILGAGNEKAKLEVFNIYGARVYLNENYDNDFTGAGLTEGVYFYAYTYPGCEVQVGWVHVVK